MRAPKSARDCGESVIGKKHGNKKITCLDQRQICAPATSGPKWVDSMVYPCYAGLQPGATKRIGMAACRKVFNVAGMLLLFGIVCKLQNAM